MPSDKKLKQIRSDIIDQMSRGKIPDVKQELEDNGFKMVSFEELIGNEEMSEDELLTVARGMVGKKVLLTFSHQAQMFDSDIAPDDTVYVKNIAIEAVIKRFIPDFKGGLSKRLQAIYDKPEFAELKKMMTADLNNMEEGFPGGIEVEFPEPVHVEYVKDNEDGTDSDLDAQGEAHHGVIALGQIYSIVPADEYFSGLVQ